MTATKRSMKFVEIVWNDHNTQTDGWQSLERVADRSTPVEIISLGAIAHETPELISLIHTLSDSGNALHAITILKSCILKRTNLYKKK